MLQSKMLYGEKKNFVFFLIFIVLSAFLILFQDKSDFILGGLGIFWGAYGFFRLVFLTQKETAPYNGVLSLPARLIFGLNQEQQKNINQINNRLSRMDILFWMFVGIAFIAWALYCSFYPNEIQMVQKLRDEQELLINFPLRKTFYLHAVMGALSFYGMIGIITLCAFSYGAYDFFRRSSALLLLPIFLTGGIMSIVISQIANPILLPDPHKFVGGGLGQGDILKILLENMYQASGTGLFDRSVELGFIGAYGVYILFLPVVILSVRALIMGIGGRFYALSALICLVLLCLFDMFLLQGNLPPALLIIAVPYITLCQVKMLTNTSL